LFQTKLLQKTLSVASKNRKVSISKSRQGERILDTKIATLSEFALKFRSWQLDFTLVMDFAPTLTPYNLMRIYECKNKRTMWKIDLIEL
jgi:hypothetical protein